MNNENIISSIALILAFGILVFVVVRQRIDIVNLADDNRRLLEFKQYQSVIIDSMAKRLSKNDYFFLENDIRTAKFDSVLNK